MTFRPSIAYIGLVGALGAASLGYSLIHGETQDWARYAFYCAIALIASRMKVKLPGVTGTMSMNFLLVLVMERLREITATQSNSVETAAAGTINLETIAVKGGRG